MNSEIQSRLWALQDEKYKAFSSKLIPNISEDKIIGVRTPQLRALAKAVIKENKAEAFLSSLPHDYQEENGLHAFIINEEKDYNKVLMLLKDFLPYVDNWAICDGLSPKIFKKHKTELLKEIDKWLLSEHIYTVRFAIEMLMTHFLDEDFDEVFCQKVAAVKSDEYYLKMMVAWYFATALAKQWDSAVPFIEKRTLDEWTHRKTIQKAVESYRITDEQKTYLRKLK
ncbi:MAG: DNA alkylation repair protein [Acutalibacteraceae bacterium]